MRISQRFIFILTIILILMALSALSIHKARDSSHCLSCGSTRDICQVRGGAFWPERSVALSEPWEELTASRFFEDWLGDRHTHHSGVWQRSGTYALGLRWASRISFLVWSPHWIDIYERDPNFRRWLLDRVREGRVSRESLMAAAAAVGRRPPSDGVVQGVPVDSDNLGDQLRAEYEASQNPR